MNDYDWWRSACCPYQCTTMTNDDNLLAEWNTGVLQAGFHARVMLQAWKIRRVGNDVRFVFSIDTMGKQWSSLHTHGYQPASVHPRSTGSTRATQKAQTWKVLDCVAGAWRQSWQSQSEDQALGRAWHRATSQKVFSVRPPEKYKAIIIHMKTYACYASTLSAKWMHWQRLEIRNTSSLIHHHAKRWVGHISAILS